MPPYVRENCADYHLEEFERLLARVDIRGKDVLEIGSDYHLASARLFLANGARSVVATNIGDWRSDEPLPPGLEFRVGDVGELDFGERRFDVLYGIAVLEHLPDPRRVAEQLLGLLAPAGEAYLQGCPLWAGSLGHHVYYAPQEENYDELFAQGGSPTAGKVEYSFCGENPIPDWAHLSLDPAGLAALLVERGLPRSHAEGIAQQVYDTDGTLLGSSSNKKSASEVREAFEEFFAVDSDPILSPPGEGEYYDRARERYSEDDLRTLGVRLWMKPKTPIGAPSTQAAQDQGEQPLVSVIVPFYNVEEFFEECLESIAAQDYAALEVLLVDDCSPDGSRTLAERFVERDPRFRLVTHERNQGLGPARNTGADEARGDYLFFLDSDDFLSTRGAISGLVRAARERDVALVVGSCERLLPDGSVQGYDREYDAPYGGTPGCLVEGEAAFLGASFLPGGSYVPMRAWGSLIERELYLSSGLRFPSSAHEDLPHTPFLYYASGALLYSSDIVVTYRHRETSISNTRWGANMLQRYAAMWEVLSENLERFGLERHRGNCALKTAEHLVMKLRLNGLKAGAEDVAIETLTRMLCEARGELDEGLLCYTLDSLRSVLDLARWDYNLYHRITSCLEPRDLIRYYRARLHGGFEHHGELLVDEGPGTESHSGVVTADEDGAALIPQPPQAAQAAGADSATRVAAVSETVSARVFSVNERRVASMMREYEAGAARHMRSFPSMLTEGDKALYYHAAKGHRFEGAIVDAGCFLGATTMSLVRGLLDHPQSAQRAQDLLGRIRVYDLFQIDDDYILEHLRKNYPRREFDKGGSFQPLFEELLSEHKNWLDVRPGDVTSHGYPDDEPIEILGLDLCKALFVTDHVLRAFFPRLLPGALVIHQDYIHEFHPHIHLSMARLADHFELYAEISGGGSVAWRLKKPITPELILERFGPDDSWYAEQDTNVRLLEQLAQSQHYETNRWILTLTLGIYHWAMQDQERAVEVYERARREYPGYEPAPATRNLIGTVVR